MITLADLIERLKVIDEVSLLEVLDITSEEIVARFTDLIEERYETLVKDFQDDEAEESS